MNDELLKGTMPRGYGLGGYRFVPVKCTSRKCGWRGRRVFRYTIWGKAKILLSTLLAEWQEFRLSRSRAWFAWLRTSKYSGCFPYQRDCPKCHKPVDPILEAVK